MIKRSTTSGFTMLEVLISIVVIAFGLLGIAGLQAFALKNNQSASLRATATELSADMIDRMKANVQGLVNGDYNKQAAADYAGPAVAGCVGAGCTPTQLAVNDLFEWSQAVAARLPQGVGVVCLTATPNAGDPPPGNPQCDGAGVTNYVVKIWWVDDRTATQTVTPRLFLDGIQSMRTAHSYRSAIRGFTLVELLVALTIGMLLTIVVANLFLGSRRTYATTDNLSRMQENMRYAQEILRRTIHLAGYKTSPNLYSTGPFGVFVGGNLAIQGQEAFTATTNPPSDTITVNFQGSGTPAADGSVIDCTGNAIAGGVMSVNRFEILTDPITNGPALFCNNTVIVPDVENMQILFGEDTDPAPGDAVANRFVAANAAPAINPDRIVSVRIALLFRTPEIAAQIAADAAPYSLNGTAVPVVQRQTDPSRHDDDHHFTQSHSLRADPMTHLTSRHRQHGAVLIVYAALPGHPHHAGRDGHDGNDVRRAHGGQRPRYRSRVPGCGSRFAGRAARHQQPPGRRVPGKHRPHHHQSRIGLRQTRAREYHGSLPERRHQHGSLHAEVLPDQHRLDVAGHSGQRRRPATSRERPAFNTGLTRARRRTRSACSRASRATSSSFSVCRRRKRRSADRNRCASSIA